MSKVGRGRVPRIISARRRKSRKKQDKDHHHIYDA